MTKNSKNTPPPKINPTDPSTDLSAKNRPPNYEVDMPQGEEFQQLVRTRRQSSARWRRIFLFSTVLGIVVLGLLLFNVVNQSMGLVAIQNKVNPATLTNNGVLLADQTPAQLEEILRENLRRSLIRRIDTEQPLAERSQSNLLGLIQEQILEAEIVESWDLVDSIRNRAVIEAAVTEEYPNAVVEYRRWINTSFLTSSQSSDPAKAGVRTAIFGSLWVIAITLLFSLPIGVGAAIYLEEYATDNRLNRFIKTNIDNLAGVPSIIYGMLGLAIFVRFLEPLTSGAIFGVASESTANGRTILSAGLTLGLLVLPLIIINSQEAIRAVPSSLRQAAYGIGATKWQVIWHHVLRSALPGILTGNILAMSRAIGETAPIVVIGASTFIALDPDGPFSKFTTLPVQIYQWTARPQPEFQHIAAAAIVVLLILLLSLNAVAILLRNRYSRNA